MNARTPWSELSHALASWGEADRSEANGSDAPAFSRPDRYAGREPEAAGESAPEASPPARGGLLGLGSVPGLARLRAARDAEAAGAEPGGEETRSARPSAPRSHPAPLPARAPYAELHVHSDFSFLDGASDPEELVETAAAAGLTGIALTDHNGLYGAPRFAAAAAAHGIATVFGAELSLGLTARIPGQVDPAAEHLLVLARGVDGYRSLSAALTRAHLAGEKNRPVFDREALLAHTRESGQWQLLTGCRKGALGRALTDPHDPDGGLSVLRRLRDAAGPDNLVVELTHAGLPGDDRRIRHLEELAARAQLPTVATNAVHYATRARFRDAAVRAAVRARRPLAEMTGWLPPTAAARIRSGEEMLARFPRISVQNAAALAAETAFSLRLAAPGLPHAPIPEEKAAAGVTEAQHLRDLVEEGTLRRYGTRSERPDAWAQIEEELDLIERMGFCGYFLIVHHITEFCRREDIYCQGRGSAANSAVCFVLGITAVDAVEYTLVFERFLTPEREGYPDIDIDIESGRREEVIQHVYEFYGRDRAAQVANVITYRARSAVRDAAAALGYEPGQQDAFSKGMDRWRSLPEPEETEIPLTVLEYARDLLNTPRHMGIHSGGMILADRPIGEVVPIEPATMPDRTVVQWDKDDCAEMGLVKFDLLGLGMLTALHEMLDLVAAHTGERIDRAEIPPDDPATYAMLRRGDAVGVFQVESRAQIATLPRLGPEEFYDLVVQVALIRPGPIQGGSVHPYIRRSRGDETPVYLHQLLENSIERTLGVPLFQEQLMQMSMDVGGFTGRDADELRRAMGAKRSEAAMARLGDRFLAGAAQRGVPADVAEEIFRKIAAFADYGFPESHAMSFANLVYHSAWLKRHHHAAFTAGLLRAQPMGFYSPQSLLADARRHGVRVLPVCVNRSGARADLERDPDSEGGFAIRLGLDSVRGLGKEAAEAVVEVRGEDEFSSAGDLAQRTGLGKAALEGLATAGALSCFGLDRRRALWVAGGQAGASPATLPGTSGPVSAPVLPDMDAFEDTLAQLWATGVTVDGYPTEVLREQLTARGYGSTADALAAEPRTRVTIAGIVTHRQRPATAEGLTFFNLEDEAGMLNVVCTAGLLRRYRRIALTKNVLAVTGIIQRAETAESTDAVVVSLYADRLTPIRTQLNVRSRDFR
ncbi:error-prone DNA polymerase [Brevibacterium sp.]|uniref:error-prone DNA polymerase n=1 Tax=Brevibacterium sp. TaxID=1701 RepID=UPI0025C19EC4|nr:error-prone DNA polymerase [Brevibacterium sp.]